MFKFSLRDMLWLTLVVALTVGWVLDHQSLRKVVSNRIGEERKTRIALTSFLVDTNSALQTENRKLKKAADQSVGSLAD